MIKDFNKVPAAAFHFGGGEVAFENPDSHGNYPIRMVARSPLPIEHWFWGRIVHDISGFKTHKDILPVDYLHDEEIGYLDKFEQTSEGLVVTGAIVLTKEASDPSRKVLARRNGGVPYEASINWAGDGAVLEQVPEGFSVPVNGYQFQGPGVVVREWPLRGVAVCPYGADMHTESEFNQSNKFFSVTLKGGNMPNAKEQTEAVAEVVETPVVAEAVTDTPAEVVETEKPAEANELSSDRKEMKRFRDAFGAKGLEWFADGLTFDQARDKQTSELNATVKQQATEITDLKKKLSLPTEGEQSAVTLINGGEKKEAKGFASKIRFK